MSFSIESFFLLAGALFILLGSIGVLKFPDTLSRAHALSKALTFGLALMLIGFWIHLGKVWYGVKIIPAIVFLFLTIPLAGHIFALYAADSTKQE